MSNLQTDVHLNLDCGNNVIHGPIETISYNNQSIHLLISPYCRIYASMNPVNIGSDNGLSLIRRQVII